MQNAGYFERGIKWNYKLINKKEKNNFKRGEKQKSPSL